MNDRKRIFRNRSFIHYYLVCLKWVWLRIIILYFLHLFNKSFVILTQLFWLDSLYLHKAHTIALFLLQTGHLLWSTWKLFLDCLFSSLLFNIWEFGLMLYRLFKEVFGSIHWWLHIWARELSHCHWIYLYYRNFWSNLPETIIFKNYFAGLLYHHITFYRKSGSF